MTELNVIIASTRPGRAGLPIANWFVDVARAHGALQVVVSDLKELALPHLDEAKHPRLGQYEHAHTKAWSERVQRSDAFVIVTPEYNYFAAPALINAIDYLFAEWAYKPVGLVSYGGASGGLRSAQAIKPLLTTLKMMPIPEGVAIPFFNQQLSEGVFTGTDSQVGSAKSMLDELARWADALKPLRA